MTPFSTIYMAQLAVKAGIPAGLINVVLGDGPTTGNALTGHADIAKVSFTGSTRAGSAIMENIARTGVKPMTLELGGKSPQLVFADADLDKAAAAIAGSVIFNAGQACVAGTRLIVEKSVADELIAAIIARMQAARPGPTWDAATQYSPIISGRQRGRIASIVEAAKAAGGECLTGGEEMEGAGYFYAPTLIGGVAQDNPAIVEEIFGPVLTVQTFETEEEALTLSATRSMAWPPASSPRTSPHAALSPARWSRNGLGQPLQPVARPYPADRRLQALRHRQGPRPRGL